MSLLMRTQRDKTDSSSSIVPVHRKSVHQCLMLFFLHLDIAGSIGELAYAIDSVSETVGSGKELLLALRIRVFKALLQMPQVSVITFLFTRMLQHWGHPQSEQENRQSLQLSSVY